MIVKLLPVTYFFCGLTALLTYCLIKKKKMVSKGFYHCTQFFLIQ